MRRFLRLQPIGDVCPLRVVSGRNQGRQTARSGPSKTESDVIFRLVLIVVIALLGIGGRWLFRQRSPEEIYAAREKLKRLRKRDR